MKGHLPPAETCVQPPVREAQEIDKPQQPMRTSAVASLFGTSPPPKKRSDQHSVAEGLQPYELKKALLGNQDCAVFHPITIGTLFSMGKLHAKLIPSKDGYRQVLPLILSGMLIARIPLVGQPLSVIWEIRITASAWNLSLLPVLVVKHVANLSRGCRKKS
jgi:hypothetical protein